MAEKIRKRDGTVVDFDASKIKIAIAKAIGAVRGGVVDAELNKIMTLITADIDTTYKSATVDVEGVQDIVEQCLMKAGYYDVAKAYILYRERHAEIRKERRNETLKSIEERRTFVVNEEGQREVFDEQRLRRFIGRACAGYEGVVNVEEILVQCESGIHDGMHTKDIAELAVMTARGFIERNPLYDTITSRLFLSNLYYEATGSREWNPAGVFESNIRRAVEQERLDPEMLKFDFSRLSKELVKERDELIPYRGLQTLYDRYFISDTSTKRVMETPQSFWMRVAMGLAINEKDRDARAIEFYGVLSRLEFVSSTPTLFHSGTMHPQMSSCYLTTVQDDLVDIFKSYSDNAQLSKWSGGVANDWGNIRATGAYIKSTGVESQGVIPFLKIANDVTVAINRSGKRRGATCAYIEAWHADVEDFIDLRRNTGDERRRTHDMNIALWVPDLLVKRVMSDGEWTLFSPEEVPNLHHIYGKKFEVAYSEYEKSAGEGRIKLFKRMKARDIWKRILTQLYETGHPWITFKDPSNIRSPQDHVGVVHSSNLCTEITLNTSKDETAVCNLGSLNIAKHITDGKLDTERVARTVKIAMRMLDNVIDLNYYPTIESRTSNMRHRPVGLGIMGFQDALYMMGINFASEEAVRFADESMELISYHAILASSDLAAERGAYESFKGSKWDRGIFPIDTLDILEQERGVKINVPRSSTLNWESVREAVKRNGMRNSNCMAIAPTATISNIAGCLPSIEPIYNEVYVKSNMSGEFTVVDRYLVEDLKKEGLWNKHMLEEIKASDGTIQNINSIPTRIKERHKNAFEIEPEWLIKIAAYRGKWIDQSQSLNIFTNTTSGKRLSEIYLNAWMMGLKTTYYLRTLGASSIEKSTVSINRQTTKAAVQEAGMQVVVESVEGMTENMPVLPAEAKQLDASDGFEIKACKIDDPDCEACQ